MTTPTLTKATHAADRIAALLGANSTWDSAADYLETIAIILTHAGYPNPGAHENLARYRALADKLGIEHDGPRPPVEGDTAECSCGFDLVWAGDEWQHDAAPWRWGDDHLPNPQPDE